MFRDIVVPKQVARPTLCLYEPGMTYGYHVDEAVFPSTPPMRSDVSCTVFVSDPDDYQGGELEVESGAGIVSFKCAAGEAVVYPSTTVHRVAPVTDGRRIVAITWFQSMIRDQRQRDVLLQLQQVANILHTAGDPQGGRTITEAIRTNLMRMGAELEPAPGRNTGSSFCSSAGCALSIVSAQPSPCRISALKRCLLSLSSRARNSAEYACSGALA